MFDSHFSDALRKEYSSKGIIVQVCGLTVYLDSHRSCLPPSLSISRSSHAPPTLLSFPCLPLICLYPFLSFSTYHLTQEVKPSFVATALVHIQRTSRSIPSPITYARAAVATIGIQHTTSGYFYHALQVRWYFCGSSAVLF